jgi:RecA/RadA recombinase
MSLRINFYGGPGVGKSTLAAHLFAWLKQEGFDTELAQEWIKTWVYQNRRMASFDYVYTFANQLHTEDRLLQAGINIVVTDSPLYLQVIYALHQKMEAANELWKIARRFEAAYPSVNFVVARQTAYKPLGRYETAQQAAAMDPIIQSQLESWSVPFTTIQPGDVNRVIAELDKQYGILARTNLTESPRI